MPELRRPPVTKAAQVSSWTKLGAVAAGVAALAALGALGLSLSSAQPSASTDLDREVAAKLLAAGVLEEAGELYERVLRDPQAAPETRGTIAFSLGSAWLERGAYELALRWFYEAEIAGDDDIAAEAASKVVHCLERLGRIHEAQAVLASRTALDAPAERSAEDPVVAKVGAREIRASELTRAIDDLPPQLAEQVSSAEGRAKFLEKYVADELLWRKAQKLEYTKDPEVRRQLEAALRQIVVSAFVEREVVGRVQTTEGDLKTWYQAHKVQYRSPAEADVDAIVLGSAAEAEGTDFDTVAKAKGTKRDTVVQGKASWGISSPSVLAPLFTSEPGDVVGPLPLSKGVVWLKVAEVRPGEAQAFDDVRDQVMRDLQGSKVQEAWGSLIEEQLSASDVQLFPEALEPAR
jgi:peptidyl-prolyl cis-trans isomerase C